MFYSITGKLILSDTTKAVVLCGGVAFKCFTTLSTLSQLPPQGQEVTLFAHLNVKEDLLDLYGFFTETELDFFRQLLSVSGVGPKVALAILSGFSPDKVALMITSGDSKSLTKASGVGAKLAQRIVLELKDKIGGSLGSSREVDIIQAAGSAVSGTNTAQAVDALTALGYTQSEAAAAVGALDASLSVETLIKSALKSMSKQ